MKRVFLSGAVLTFLLVFRASTGWADIQVDFDGSYKDGLCDGWKTEKDPWGTGPVSPIEVSPGFDGKGKAQGLRVSNGSHFVVQTLSGLTPGLDYVVSVRVCTARGDGKFETPKGWVEFGWDSRARNITWPNTNMIWCADPKLDFAQNTGNWIKYTGEPFRAIGTSVTIAFKVGSMDPGGITGQFDNLVISQHKAPPVTYRFPDNFDSTYKFGTADGWAKRFLSGGVTPRWAQAAGRSGSAQHLYAGTEAPGLGIDIGVVKVFEITPNRTYTVSVWISASDSSSRPLTNPFFDPGPIVKFGVDPTGQTTNPTTATIQWKSDPTQYFIMSGKENTWNQFTSAPFQATGNTVSVWLWVEGDNNIGVSAKFDDLTLNSSSDSKP